MSVPKPIVRLTREAKQDFADIVLYSRRTWGAEQKTTYRKRIGQALRRLIAHPRIEQPRDDLFLGCRVLRVGEHMIYDHQPGDSEIVILRMLQARQDAASLVHP